MTTVLITGSEGNIGTYLVRQLEQTRPDIKVLCVKFGKLASGAHKEGGVYVGDLADRFFVEKIFQENKIDYVIHAAARSYGPESFNQGYAVFNNDLGILMNVLQFCGGTKKFVYLSSAMVYESSVQTPFTENQTENILPPKSPLGLSKYVGEKAVELFALQNNINYTIWRMFNVVSPLEGHEGKGGHVFIDFYRKIFVEKNTQITIAGSGQQMRCFTWVGDVAEAIAGFLTDERTANQTFNIGSSEPKNLLQLKETLVQIGKERNILSQEYNPATVTGSQFFGLDVELRIPSTQKLQEKLGYECKTTFAECFEKFIDGKNGMQRKQCPLCASHDTQKVIDLGLHPLADTFLKEIDILQMRYPLQVFLCNDCGYAGLIYVVDAQKRYQEHEYSYTSSNSPVAINHFSEMAGQAIERLNVAKKDLVVDIGSNAGTLLQAFREKAGCAVVGVEPSENIAKLAESQGVETIQDFFDSTTARKILQNHGQAKVITCTNVFNHITDLADFMQNVALLLAPDGQLVIETPYLLSLVKDVAFDTIYLEHISYFAVKPFEKFFKTFGLHVTHLEMNDYMGGSIRVYVGKGNQTNDVVAEFIRREEIAGIFSGKTYEALMEKVSNLKEQLLQQITTAKAGGKKIIGIGAATKGNTLLNYCGIDATMLDFVTDSSPLKIGKFMPGSNIPIKSDGDITQDITHALILPWNIAAFLREKLQHLGLTFITPKI